MNSMIDIATVLKELYTISGFRVSVHGTDFSEIVAYPETICDFCSLIQNDLRNKEKCLRSDGEAFIQARKTGKPFVYNCSFGLWEAVAPLYHFGVLSGYLMMGQVRLDTDNSDVRLIELCSRYSAGDEEAKRAVASLPVIQRSRLDSYLNIMTICAEYITLTGKLVPVSRSLASQVRRYVNANYAKKITLDELADQFKCSKSTLMNVFKRDCNQTIINYINNVRMDHAITMLENGEESINDIANACGFCDQCYFSKLFMRKFSMTPTRYRSLHRKNASSFRFDFGENEEDR